MMRWQKLIKGFFISSSQKTSTNIYKEFIATTKDKKNSDAIKKLVKAYQSDNVANYINNESGTGEIAVWSGAPKPK